MGRDFTMGRRGSLRSRGGSRTREDGEREGRFAGSESGRPAGRGRCGRGSAQGTPLRCGGEGECAEIGAGDDGEGRAGRARLVVEGRQEGVREWRRG